MHLQSHECLAKMYANAVYRLFYMRILSCSLCSFNSLTRSENGRQTVSVVRQTSGEKFAQFEMNDIFSRKHRPLVPTAFPGYAIYVQKLNLHCTCVITPKRVTSGVAHLHGSVHGQYIFQLQKTSLRWRATDDTVFNLIGPRIEPKAFRTRSDVVIARLT